MLILEEFYYGNITPTEEIIQTRKYKKALQAYVDLEVEFIRSLNKGQKEKFDELSNLHRTFSVESDKELFIAGYRIAAKTMIDVLCADDR